MLAHHSKDKNNPHVMINKNALLGFFNREHYQIYHTPVARRFKSIEAAILLTELAQRHQFHEARCELIEIPERGEGWFYLTREIIEERTAMSRRQMDNAVEILLKNQIIETTKYGMPCKRYFRLNFAGIEELSNNLSSLHTAYKQDCTPCTNKVVQNVQTGLRGGVQTDSLYIEEHNKEPKKERAQPASAPASIFKKIEREPFVHTSEKEHATLLDKHGEVVILQAYKRLSLWKQDTPKARWKKNDYNSICRWVIDAVIEDEEKKKKRQGAKTEAPEPSHAYDHRMWFNSACLKIGKPSLDESYTSNLEFVQFRNLKNSNESQKIFFKDLKFKDLVKNELRKRNYTTG